MSDFFEVEWTLIGQLRPVSHRILLDTARLLVTERRNKLNAKVLPGAVHPSEADLEARDSLRDAFAFVLSDIVRGPARSGTLVTWDGPQSLVIVSDQVQAVRVVDPDALSEPIPKRIGFAATQA